MCFLFTSIGILSFHLNSRVRQIGGVSTNERTRVIDAVREVLRYTDKDHLPVLLDRKMPTGPMNRVADNALAKKLLGWEPKVKFVDGLRATIDWYYGTQDRKEVASTLHHMLTERSPSGRRSADHGGIDHEQQVQ